MFKYKFKVLIFILIIFSLSIYSVEANPLTFEDEFDHYLKYGIHSQNFYSNLIESRDEKTKKEFQNFNSKRKTTVGVGPEKKNKKLYRAG